MMQIHTVAAGGGSICRFDGGRFLVGPESAGADPGLITVVRPSGRVPAPGIRTLTAMPEGEAPALVLLGVKPQKLAEVAPDVAPAIGPDTILVSILAGTTLATLRGNGRVILQSVTIEAFAKALVKNTAKPDQQGFGALGGLFSGSRD